MRLQKLVSQLGIASRRTAESWIANGRFTVNGKIVTELGTKVDPERDAVRLDGKRLKTAEATARLYWLMYKPSRVLTNDTGIDGRKNIYSLPAMRRMKVPMLPVGRLDYLTEGVLILTNDGDLNHALSRSRVNIEREYQVFLEGRVTSEDEAKVRKGIRLSDGQTGPVKLKYLDSHDGESIYRMIVGQGRQQIVRRIFEKLGYKIKKLVRVSFAGVDLPPDLKLGDVRALTSSEIAQLKRSAQQAEEEA